MRVRSSNAIVSGLGNLPAPVPLQEDDDFATYLRRTASSSQSEMYAYWMRTSLHAAEVVNGAMTHQVSLAHATRAYRGNSTLGAQPKPVHPGHFSKIV